MVAGRDAVSLDRQAVRIEFGDDEQPFRFLETLARLDRQFDAWLGANGIDRFTAPALTQELVTALARCPWLGVRCSPEAADCDYRVEGYLVPRGIKVRTVLQGESRSLG